LGGPPADVVEGVDTRAERHAGVFGHLVVLDEVFEDGDVALEIILLVVQVGDVVLHAFGVVLYLGVEAGFGLVDEMAVVLPLDEAFEAESDEKADGDGGEVEEKVAPAVHRLVWGMDIDHSRDLVEIH
jgi:hypothetical protein